MKFLTYIFVLISFSLSAQGKTEIVFHFQNNESFPAKFFPKKNFQKEDNAKRSLQKLIYNLYAQGYIEASIDSVVSENQKLHSYMYMGKRYKLSQLENGNIEESVVKKFKFKDENYSNKNFSFKEIEKLEFDILNYYENRGYAFAEVYLDSISIVNQQVVSKIYAKPNALFLIDTIIVVGETKTKSKYLQNFLDIKKGDLYDKSKIKKIKQRIAQLSFVRESKDAQVVFLNGKAEVYIFLEKQKSNQFDLLVGIAPNSSLTKSKINITGDGKLHLRNSFGVGEEIYVDFKQLKPRTQNLDLKLNYPYLLNLPFGIETSFGLFKNDTLFLNLNTKAGLHYAFNGADYLQLLYFNNTSNVLNYDSSAIRASNQLPDVLDISNNRFGVGFHFQNLDYILNPRKGYDITIGGAVGTKKIRESAVLKEIDSEIYKDIKLRSFNYSFDLDFEYNFPILKRHSIQVSNESRFFISKNILDNEKYRIGGANSIRGFDEDEIFTPYFSLFTLEYHFLLSKNTYFYSFGDLALVEDARFDNGRIDTPFGFGVGAALETKGGIFSLSYALGAQLGNKLEIKNGKIHFGYINLF